MEREAYLLCKTNLQYIFAHVCIQAKFNSLRGCGFLLIIPNIYSNNTINTGLQIYIIHIGTAFSQKYNTKIFYI